MLSFYSEAGGGSCFLGFGVIWVWAGLFLRDGVGGGGGSYFVGKGICNVLGLFWGFAVLFWEGKGLVFWDSLD